MPRAQHRSHTRKRELPSCRVVGVCDLGISEGGDPGPSSTPCMSTSAQETGALEGGEVRHLPIKVQVQVQVLGLPASVGSLIKPCILSVCHLPILYLLFM